MLLPAGAGLLGAQTAPRYEAVFSDGSRLEGRQLTGWSRDAYSPRLDGTSLDDPKRPLRWLKDRRLKPWRKPPWCDGYIEFVGGDRIIGRVVGSRPDRDAGGVHFPAHLLVAPARDPKTPARVKSPKPIRVLIDMVKRIVMTANPRGDYRPGRLVRRGGRDVDFVSLRVREDSLHVLLSNTAVTVKFDDIVEICFPQVDPWEAYFRMLGVLSPGGRLRLVRFETVDGLIATASALRIEEQAYAADSHKQRALSQLNRLDADLVRLEPELKQHEKTLASARDEYAKLSTQLEKSPAGDSSKRLAGMKSKVAGALQRRDNTRRHIAYVKLQRKKARGAGGASDSWSHVIQPIWSLDAMRIPFNRIHTRWSLAPGRLPLSMIHPTASVSPPFQSWRAGRISGGRSFNSAGREYCWGFAVHAYSELAFALPKCVTSFRSRLGLDRIVDTGGCARARVFLGSTAEKPLYASGLLIGSNKTVDTGPIAIETPANGPKRLVLQADMAHRDRPSGADPLNIRDKLDWLEPVIGFDPAGLQEAVDRMIVDQQGAWKGWTVKFDKRGGYSWAGRFQKDRPTERGSFRTMLQAGKHPLVLSRSIAVGPDDNWLTVDADRSTAIGTSRPAAVSLRIDNKTIKPENLPVRQAWQRKDAPMVFAIRQYRRKKVTLELTQPTGSTEIVGHTVGLSGELPQEYRIAAALKKVMALRDAAPLPAKWGQGARDLLKSVNPTEDAVYGKWTKPGGQLLSDWRTNARCQLSAGSQGSYQLEIQFTRIAGDCMAVMLPVGRTGVLLVVSGWGGEVSGLAYINRKDADRNETSRAGKLENGVKHTLLITTRLLKGNRARIDVTLNGKPYIKWEGSASALLPDGAWRLRDSKLFGLGAYNAIVIFHSCQFKTLDDRPAAAGRRISEARRPGSSAQRACKARGCCAV